MPDINAFTGWRYDAARVKDPARVFAPPYDVISKKEQAALHTRSPYNVVRLELGLEKKGDDARENKYVRAGRTLREWENAGVLRREGIPAFYIYVQDYREGRRARRRIGFFAAMRVDEKAVLKHENTLDAPKKDRFALLSQVRTNLSPVFGLFEDPSGRVQAALKDAASGRPVYDVTADGVRHRFYVDTDRERIAKIRAALAKRPMYIADGHHRFEVSCQYKRAMEERGAPPAAWDRVLTYFTDCRHNPFTIWPTHRLVKKPASMRSVFAALEALGTLRPVRGLGPVLKTLARPRHQSVGGQARRASDRDRYTFGVYTKADGFGLFGLSRRIGAKAGPTAVDRMDVAVLHSAVIAPAFHIEKIAKSEAIDFTRDAREAVRRVRSGEFDAAFFLRPTSLDEMLAASRKGLKMPQKSTYFYPKLLSGLVFHGLE